MKLQKSDQKTPKNSDMAQKPERKMTLTSANSRSFKKLEVQMLESGLQLILNESLLRQISDITSGQAIEVIKDHMIKYLKQQEVFSRLRPVDIQLLCEYCFLIYQFTQTITNQSSFKRPLICNILLDLYFNDNPKFMKIAATSLLNMKRSEKDILKLQKWLRAHQEQLNSQEIIQIIRWSEVDYLSHYQLFHFQSQRDQGALDIVYIVSVEIPEAIPPLIYANFIPQQIKQESDQDSQEEDIYAYKISYINQKKDDDLLGQNLKDDLQVVPNNQNNKVQIYIETQLAEAQNGFDQKLDQHSKKFNDSLMNDKSKNAKK